MDHAVKIDQESRQSEVMRNRRNNNSTFSKNRDHLNIVTIPFHCVKNIQIQLDK